MIKIGKKVKFNDSDRVNASLHHKKGTVVSECLGFYNVKLDGEDTLVSLVNEFDLAGIRGRPRKIPASSE